MNNSDESVGLYTNFISIVPFKYRKRCLTACQCMGPGLELNRARMLTAFVMSGRVVIARYINAPTALRYGVRRMRLISSGVEAPIDLSRRWPGSIGVSTELQSDSWNRSNMLRMYWR